MYYTFSCIGRDSVAQDRVDACIYLGVGLWRRHRVRTVQYISSSSTPLSLLFAIEYRVLPIPVVLKGLKVPRVNAAQLHPTLGFYTHIMVAKPFPPGWPVGNSDWYRFVFTNPRGVITSHLRNKLLDELYKRSVLRSSCRLSWRTTRLLSSLLG